jgi:hypothetical protein
MGSYEITILLHRDMNLTTHLHPPPRSKMAELYLNFPISLLVKHRGNYTSPQRIYILSRVGGTRDENDGL